MEKYFKSSWELETFKKFDFFFSKKHFLTSIVWTKIISASTYTTSHITL